jgi:uncharacterized protein
MSFTTLAFASACVFVAGVVRGFSGFGFALLSIASVSMVLPPAVVVPAMWLLDFIAGLNLLPGIIRQIHWRSIAILTGAAVVATPIGVYALATAPSAIMRIGLAIFVMASALALLSGFQLKRMPSTAETAATGIAAGLLNGAFGIGGPPVILFFLGSPLALEAGRASIIAAFLIMDLTGIPSLLAFGLITVDALKLLAACLPALIVGIVVGSRLVGRLDERRVRQALLMLLIAMALVIGMQGLRSLATS